MKIAGLIQDSIVDGPGLRFAVFVQGCGLSCEGCHNPDALDVDGGMEMGVDEVVAEMLSNPLTDGLSLSGGEPFMQAADCANIAAVAQANGKNVWVYSGYRFEELLGRATADSSVKDLLEATDVLVDGRFILSERTLSMKWRGSKNQRFVDVQKSIEAGSALEFKIES
ncbi:MAG: anaerobic ribonucleoside-triphosphate reductase activating protein [Oscillospiraceae bacterium]|nr:anaerobic ribonucleoside-triphosphate reductase activating protein [Oscillospiraceae bacterium]